MLREGLRLNGVEVIECHHSLWDGIEDKSQVHGMGRWLKLATNALFAYPRLILRYLRAPRHDVVLVAYPGLLDLFVLRPFAWLRRTPLAWDWFLSAYDTIVLDRRMVSRRNPLAWLIRAVEWTAARLADSVFMDTAAHARRMELLFGLPAHRVERVWVGAEESIFSEITSTTGSPDCAQPDRNTTVLFYGQFIPLHGIPTIIEAAQLLRDEDISWTLVGRGQEAPHIRELLQSAGLPKLQWIEWLEYGSLRDAMQRADVVLGIFGTSEKAASVIPNKVFQTLMTQRPLITRDSPAIRELIRHSPPSIQLVPAGDAAALAEAVMTVRNSRVYSSELPILAFEPFDTAAIGRQLLEVLQQRTPAGRYET
ncbi:MAG TPA: glycosyltransferase [Lysobacter sp.]|nr:glycosyltransferase [Lysobacter sp.]